jgi:hypothetical protein
MKQSKKEFLFYVPRSEGKSTAKRLVHAQRQSPSCWMWQSSGV